MIIMRKWSDKWRWPAWEESTCSYLTRVNVLQVGNWNRNKAGCSVIVSKLSNKIYFAEKFGGWEGCGREKLSIVFFEVVCCHGYAELSLLSPWFYHNYPVTTFMLLCPQCYCRLVYCTEVPFCCKNESDTRWPFLYCDWLSLFCVHWRIWESQIMWLQSLISELHKARIISFLWHCLEWRKAVCGKSWRFSISLFAGRRELILSWAECHLCSKSLKLLHLLGFIQIAFQHKRLNCQWQKERRSGRKTNLMCVAQYVW